MSLFKDQYRVESTRVPGWDYSSPAWYFITICTRNHVCTLGDVIGSEVILSPAGKVVAEEWQATACIRDHVELDAWVIMPNHLHGILIINDSPAPVETTRRVVSEPAMSERYPVPPDGQARRPAGSSLQAGSLGSIIGQLKSVCTKRIRAAGHTEFGWQSRFYDHIIRDGHSLDRIRRYIDANPAKWHEDKNHTDNVPPAGFA